jgi:hypothetical protein
MVVRMASRKKPCFFDYVFDMVTSSVNQLVRIVLFRSHDRRNYDTGVLRS